MTSYEKEVLWKDEWQTKEMIPGPRQFEYGDMKTAKSKM